MKLLFATLLAFVALTIPAHAEPISIGSSIGLFLFTAGVPLTGFTATTAAILGNISLNNCVQGKGQMERLFKSNDTAK